MTRIEDQLHDLRTIRLPEEARLRLRAELSAYADLHAYAPQPVRSPFYGFHTRLYAGLAAVLVLVLGVGGTAYASTSALPGDTLYAVKVKVAEPIQTALVPSESGKAAWHAILAERRLEEAAQLAAQERLTAGAQEELASNFNTHVTAADRSADELEEQGDATGALSVRSDLEARLTAHERILAVLAAHYAATGSPDGRQTGNSLRALLAVVSTHERQTTSARVALEDAIAPDTQAPSAATMAAKVAVAEPAPAPAEGFAPAAAHIEQAEALRMQEVDSILEHHAALLAKFLPAATTTATTTATTATTTATTTQDMETQSTTTVQIFIK